MRLIKHLIDKAQPRHALGFHQPCFRPRSNRLRLCYVSMFSVPRPYKVCRAPENKMVGKSPHTKSKCHDLRRKDENFNFQGINLRMLREQLWFPEQRLRTNDLGRSFIVQDPTPYLITNYNNGLDLVSKTWCNFQLKTFFTQDRDCLSKQIKTIFTNRSYQIAFDFMPSLLPSIRQTFLS